MFKLIECFDNLFDCIKCTIEMYFLNFNESTMKNVSILN
jgi:hypothetical protein